MEGQQLRTAPQWASADFQRNIVDSDSLFAQAFVSQMFWMLVAPVIAQLRGDVAQATSPTMAEARRQVVSVMEPGRA